MNSQRPLDELLAAAANAEAARKQVGRAVKGLRSATGMNQMTFASATGISQSYLSQIETGERTPSSSTINKIATTASNTNMLRFNNKGGITNAQEENGNTKDND